ncbi:MAG: ABC transporter permease subunit [Thermoplasmatota archaeon]|nr:ABC transporter permease subunit [Candidatus Thermoplasmatota archaeon]
MFIGSSARRKAFRFFAAGLPLLVIATAFLALASPHPDAVSSVSRTAMFQDEPVADAGPNQNVTKGSEVTLNGSQSFGFEGIDNLNYTWSLKIVTERTVLYGMKVEFAAISVGVYTVNLTVRDSLNRTDWDVSYVYVKEKPQGYLAKYGPRVIGVAILGAVVGYPAYVFGSRLIRRTPLVTPVEREKTRLVVDRWKDISKKVMRTRVGFIGVIILLFFGIMAIIGPMVAGDVKTTGQYDDYLKASSSHLLGTDNFGIDIFRELLYGARTSMIVGVFSALIASFLGALVGLYSGYVGGWKDEVVMRINDVVLSIPWLVLMIIVAALLGSIDLTGIILIIGLTGWSFTARMVRAQVLSVKERQFVERARAIGSSDMDIIRKHIFPNTFPLIFANTILTVAVSILSEATLSFLHMRPVGEVTWGTMLSYAADSSAFQVGLHWWILAPGLCIVVVVLGFTLLGYALDEILNPKLRRR